MFYEARKDTLEPAQKNDSYRTVSGNKTLYTGQTANLLAYNDCIPSAPELETQKYISRGRFC